MKCLDNYRKRVGVNGVVDTKSKIIKQQIREFDGLLKVDPTSMLLPVTVPGEVNVTHQTRLLQVIINDYSNNDQKAFDEKWLFARLEDDVDLGCYVFWDNAYWLINFKESNPINAYKKFIMKKCNQIFKFKWNNIVYDIPTVVKNLTQYSDGMQDIVFTSIPDNKLSIMYGVNPITQNIKLDHRIMINKERPYRITLVENYQYNSSYDKHDGIASAIIVHTSLRDTDDKKGNIADNDSNIKPLDLHIEGYDKVMPGGKFKYGLSNGDISDWNIEYIGDVLDYVGLSIKDNECSLSIDSNMNLISNKFKLISTDLNLNKIEKEITVAGF